MKIVLQRGTGEKDSTPGQLFVDGRFECFTLEDIVRRPGVKVYGQTAIPAGTYQVVVTMSPRFKRLLPLLLNVPGFEGIRIHTGNKAADTDGCILVGDSPTAGWLEQSKVAFDRLFAKLQATRDPITIEIRPAP